MKKSLTVKLFLLTAVLCMGLLGLAAVGQYFFFNRFYVADKAERLAVQVSDYASTHGSLTEFYQKNDAWIVALDKNGTISDTEGYRVTVRLDGRSEAIAIPLYAMEGVYGGSEPLLLQQGEEVLLDVVEVGGQRIPYQLMSRYDTLALVNMSIAEKLNGIHADPAYAALKTRSFSGTVETLDLPDADSELPFPFGEHTFMEQVKAFQTELLAPAKEPPAEQMQYTVKEDSAAYQIIVEPIQWEESSGYLFAMTSLQPVNEAVGVLMRFYPFFFAAALLLVLLAALIYSRWLAKPLLSLNRVARKITELDFTEKATVRSGDELGQLSANINRLSEELQAHIGHLQQELDREKQLEQTRKNFIAGVSHELKTPLAVMKSCLLILEDGIAQEKHAHYLSAMQDKVEDMDALVMDMLELAKMESGTYRPEMSPFSLDETVRQACGSFQGRLGGTRVSLSLPPVTAIGHEKLIFRVVSNFLSNAVNHTEQGGNISVSVLYREASATVLVENEGSSLTKEEMTHVWEQFYRVHPEDRKGTGLGLSICKGILDLHHADYGAKNTDCGVCFYFTLSASLNRV